MRSDAADATQCGIDASTIPTSMAPRESKKPPGAMRIGKKTIQNGLDTERFPSRREQTVQGRQEDPHQGPTGARTKKKIWYLPSIHHGIRSSCQLCHRQRLRHQPAQIKMQLRNNCKLWSASSRRRIKLSPLRRYKRSLRNPPTSI